MKKFNNVWIWLVLVLLSLGLGGGAFWLLQQESQRIRQISNQLLAEKEAAILESFSIVLSETESGLMDSLASFPPENLESSLGRWVEENPFVAGVYVKRADQTQFSVGIDAFSPEESMPMEEVGNRELQQVLEAAPEPEPESKKTEPLQLLGSASGRSEVSLEDADGARMNRSTRTQSEAVSAPQATSNLAETRERVRQVTKEAYFEQRAIEQQIRQEEYQAALESYARNETIEAGDFSDEASLSEPGAFSPPSGFSDRSQIQMDALPSRGKESTRPASPTASSIPEVEDRIPGRTTVSSKIRGDLAPPNRTSAVLSDWAWEFVGGQPILVGEFQPFPGAPIRRVVVNREALFEALSASLPKGGIRLIQENSRLDYSRENGMPGIYRRIPETLFPGAVLFIPRESGDVFNRSFWVIAGMLIIILSGAFFLGGTFLFFQARRATLEASQKTDFLSNISHELKTPLTTIRMYAELLEEGRVADESKQKRYFHTIGAETQRLARLVNNILQFSALQKGKSRLRLQPLDLTELCRSVSESQSIRFEESGMRLLPSLPDGSMEVEADPDAVEQALINLFDNAIKYASEGEAVSCRLTREQGVARITVEDFGPGIARDQRQKIFEAFHRVDDSLTSSKPGSGLGLSITQSLFRQMDGDLLYEPNEPKGSRFHLELPLK